MTMQHKPNLPLLLDLFCCAGGAARGYHDAGFEVVGVDIKSQPRYPYSFIQADAIEFLGNLVTYGAIPGGYLLADFAAIHASPPCQAYSVAAQYHRNQGKVYPDLVAPVRAALEASGLPYVIENVPRAPLVDPVMLCGAMFPSLNVYRHRLFETNWLLPAPRHPAHDGPRPSVTGHGTPSWVRQRLGYNPTITQHRDAMGVYWMNRDELSQSIPPAYTEYVGKHLLAAVAGQVAA